MTRVGLTEVLPSKNSNSSQDNGRATVIFKEEFYKRMFQVEGTASAVTQLIGPPTWQEGWCDLSRMRGRVLRQEIKS